MTKNITQRKKGEKTMKISKGIARIVILVVCLLVLSTNVWAEGVEESAPPAPNSTYQFYNSTNFPHLTDPDPVYRSMTYDQMLKLFESEGTYMILFGGAWCGNTQAVIGQMNDVVKEYGVETIYNFHFKLDGSKFHIRDTRNESANLYVDMVNKYLTNIVTIYDKVEKGISYVDEEGETQLANKIQVPFLFIYNKDNVDANGNAAPILASIERMLRWDRDFQTDGADDAAKIETYKSEIRPLFDLVSKKSLTGKKTAQLDTYSDFDYYSTAYNGRSGETILEEGDEPWVIQTVSYIELNKLLESSGTYAMMFGGPWCGNTQAVVKYVNEYANKYNISTIYNWDTKLDSNKLQVRSSKNSHANMYVDLVRNYFPGIETVYPLEKTSIKYTDEDGNEVVANKLQVPYIFIYNKDNLDASGNPDPILGQIEHMFRWGNIQPDFVNDDGVTGANYKAYTESLDELCSLLPAVE